VYKRGKTYWIAYYGPDGKQVCESAKTADRKAARDTLHTRLGDIAAGRYVGPLAGRITYDDLATALLKDYEENERKSLRWVRIKVKKHLTPFFTGMKAQQISTADVKRYRTHRLEQQASKGEINRELAALKRMFNLAIEEERINKKPHIPMLEENNVRQGFFEPHEFNALLPKLPEYLKPPITFAYYTGWRLQSEILPLTWDRVDLDAGTVRLYQGTTKNDDGRVIHLPQVLQQIIDQQWRDHLANAPTCQWVFHKGGEKIGSFRKSWDRACKEANLSDRRIPHDFRRTAVRNLVRAGVPERVAMMITGHKTRDVFDRYNIVSAGDLAEAAKRIDGMIASQTTTSLTTSPVEPTTEASLSH
jgi:integrase